MGPVVVVWQSTRVCEAAGPARSSYDHGEPAPTSIEPPLRGVGSQSFRGELSLLTNCLEEVYSETQLPTSRILGNGVSTGHSK